MGRAKLRMELISKEKTRNTTYQKRKQGLIKKATEFSILCAVDTAVIFYAPNSDVPEIWPENPEKIKNTISTYKAKKSECGKRTYDLNDFFQDRKKKIEEELAKARKRNMEAKYATWFDELNNLSEDQLRQIAFALENKQNTVRAQIELKKRKIKFEVEYNNQIDHQFQMPLPFHYVAAPPSLDLAHTVNHGSMTALMANHNAFGLPFGCGSSMFFDPLKHEPVMYDYPHQYGMVEGPMVYNDLNPWSIHPLASLQPIVPLGLCGSNLNVGSQVLDDAKMNHGQYDNFGGFLTNK